MARAHAVGIRGRKTGRGAATGKGALRWSAGRDRGAQALSGEHSEGVRGRAVPEERTRRGVDLGVLCWDACEREDSAGREEEPTR